MRERPPAIRLGAFLLVGALVLGAAFAVGRVGGTSSAAGARGDGPRSSGMPGMSGRGRPSKDHQGSGDSMSGMAMGADQPLGLSSSNGGFRLELDPVGDSRSRTISFRILGEDGKPVTDYDVETTKLLHLIVVRRDLASFQHLHPELGSAGRWSVDAAFATPGPYHVVADFTPSGHERTVLSDDIVIAGEAPAAIPLPAPQSEVLVDGFHVEVDDGDLAAGREVAIDLTITKDGRPARIQPYLGAPGHAVLMREGDLAYLHVHPVGDDGMADGRASFAETLPSAVRYRAFVQFQVAGVVHVAAFTVDARRPR